MILIVAALPVSAHRLDEYLQGTLVSIEKNRLNAEMVLTPGVAVFPSVIAYIDTDGNGVISQAEQRAYAERVLQDLSLSINGRHLEPQLRSIAFPPVEDMKEGRGEIHLDFTADLPAGGRNRSIVLRNRHLAQIAVYQVNCLIPRDPHIRVSAQNRNYTQSVYQLIYQDASVPADPPGGSWPGRLAWLSPVALLLFARLTFVKRQARAPGGTRTKMKTGCGTGAFACALSNRAAPLRRSTFGQALSVGAGPNHERITAERPSIFNNSQSNPR